MNIKQFLNKYGTDSTTDTQLLAWGKQLGIPGLKYVMRNELLSLNRSVKNILMNYDTSDGEGNHRICIFNHPQHPCYFDSYGGSPTIEAVKFMNTKGRGIYSDFQIQPMNTHLCGQLALFVLYKLNQKPDSYIETILNLNHYINGRSQNSRR